MACEEERAAKDAAALVLVNTTAAKVTADAAYQAALVDYMAKSMALQACEGQGPQQTVPGRKRGAVHKP